MATSTDGGSSSGSGDSDCSKELPFDTPVFKVIASIRAGMGVFSLLVCLSVILLLILLRKHLFFDQRLVLYLAIASLCHSISYILGRVDFSGSRQIRDPYCYAAGFAETYTSCVELLAVLSVTGHVFVLAVLKLKRNKLDWLYLVFIFILPLVWSWVPFVFDAYATAGPWCGIRTLEPSDCDAYQTGNLLKLLLWHTPVLVFTVIALSVAIAVSVKLKREGPTCDPHGKLQVNKLRKGLLLGPIFYVLLKVPILVTDVYDYIQPVDPHMSLWFIRVGLWFIRVCLSPFAGSIILLVYFLDRRTRRRMTLNSFRAAMVESCCLCGRPEPTVATFHGCELHPTFGDSIEGVGMRRMTEYHRARRPCIITEVSTTEVIV